MKRLAVDPQNPERRSVSMLWIGQKLGQYELLSLLAFQKAGYQVSLFTYSPNLNVPLGIEVIPASEVIPRNLVFENVQTKGTFSGFSNIFRYRLLQEFDTIWVDTDVLPGFQAIPKGPYVFGWEDKNFINGAILGAPRDSRFLDDLYISAKSVPPREISWGLLGPRLITQKVYQYDLTSKAQPRKVFYPLRSRETWKFFDPKYKDEIEHHLKRSSAIHLWNEVFRQLDLKSQKPPRGSFLDVQLSRVGVVSEARDYADLEKIRKHWRPQIDPRPFEPGFLEKRAGRALRAWARVRGRVTYASR